MAQWIAEREMSPFGNKPAGGVVQAGEELVRGEVEGRQGAYGCAQLSHGRGGVQTAAGYVADDDGCPGAGQGGGVVPGRRDRRR